MSTERITVDLDTQVVTALSTRGDPSEVLGRLAVEAAANVRSPGQHGREQTDESLRAERRKADDLGLESHGVARPEQRGGSGFFAIERKATDKDLSGERARADTVLVDQREVNGRMVSATIRAQEMVDEADAAKTRAEQSEAELRAIAEFREMFIAIVGHDLRTPLGSIVMATGLLLLRGRLDEQDAETVARIIRSSQRMGRMITQLLDLTRARLGGGMPIDPTPTDIGDVCRHMAEEFDAAVVVETDGDVAGTWDKDRLEEVLSNLAGNAIEHADRGTAVVVRGRGEGDDVVVEIENRGAPIPADVLPYIFEPFRRGNARQRSPKGNLGLGLYIAKQIVLAHGGTLEASSEGGITRFVMRLPRARPEKA